MKKGTLYCWPCLVMGDLSTASDNLSPFNLKLPFRFVADKGKNP